MLRDGGVILSALQACEKQSNYTHTHTHARMHACAQVKGPLLCELKAKSISAQEDPESLSSIYPLLTKGFKGVVW